MEAYNPEEVGKLFAEAFSSGNLESAVALCEPQASLVSQPGKVVTGREAIREALKDYFALKPRLDIEVKSIIQAGEIALSRSTWSLTGIGPDGNPVQMSGHGSEVVRRQANGTWLMLIDNPFAAD